MEMPEVVEMVHFCSQKALDKNLSPSTFKQSPHELEGPGMQLSVCAKGWSTGVNDDTG